MQLTNSAGILSDPASQLPTPVGQLAGPGAQGADAGVQSLDPGVDLADPGCVGRKTTVERAGPARQLAGAIRRGSHPLAHGLQSLKGRLGVGLGNLVANLLVQLVHPQFADYFGDVVQGPVGFILYFHLLRVLV